MVSTRQMSITTVGPETGSAGVNTNGSNRMVSNSLSQQSNSTRQQANNTATVTDTLSAGPVVHLNDDKPKQLTDMPLEIFERIFQYSGYKEVSNMRLVSTQMNQICKTILNSTFTKLQSQLTKRFHNIKKTMPRRESVRRSHPLSYECDIIETCCMRLSLLQMTFGRNIERKHICFFPGAILDEVYNVLNFIRTTPNPACRPFKITEELIDLSTMAIEFFKSDLEPLMPQIGALKQFYGKNSTATRTSPKNCYLYDTQSTSAATISTRSSQSSSMPSPPQSNMVLRKGIRKIKQGMKKYNNQLSVLRTDLRFCKRKSTDQSKQITELQNMLAEQQKQTLEYANRLDENDKKNDEVSSKISTLLQELNKCKIELHYYRSKSPATPFCSNCGQTTLTIPPDNLLAYIDNNSREEIFNVLGKCNNFESKVQSHESCISQDLTSTPPVTNAAVAMATTETITAASASVLLPATTSTTNDKTLQLPIVGNMEADNSASPSLSSSASQSLSLPMNLSPELHIDRASATIVAEKAVTFTAPGLILPAGCSIECLEKRYNKPTSQATVSYGTILTSETSSTLAAATLSSLNMEATSSAIGGGGASSNDNSNGGKKSTSNGSVILTIGTPRFYGKRKLDESNTLDSLNNAKMMSMSDRPTLDASANVNRLMAAATTTTTIETPTSAATTQITTTATKTNGMATNNLANSNLSDSNSNCNKKARRVQNKLKIQTNNMNIKTRNK